MKTRTRNGALALLAAATLAGCGGGGKSQLEYRVTVTNLTAGQPMSPLLVAATTGGAVWQEGQPASVALEKLAEGGDMSDLAREIAANGGVGGAAGAAPIGPGASETHTFSFRRARGVTLTVASMLVNTNDGFAGITALPISDLAVGESMSRAVVAWDAGTEANSEAAGTIPGPADGGEGFNAARSDPPDAVRIHAGVVSHDDGLASSVLGVQQRFDNPVMRLVVERLR